MNQEHEANLRRLADYLEALPEGPKGHFDMTYVRTDPNDVRYCGYATAEPMPCGTVACALGHAPLALPDLPPEYNESWWQYAERVFNAGFWQVGGWYWVFNSQWAETDNTAKGAAARIRYMLDKGVPDDSEKQRSGSAPLSYKVSA